MKIHDACLGKSETWRKLSFPVATHGLTIFYGPNEAGKSTLVRFLRGILFGSSSSSEKSETEQRIADLEGSLGLIHQDRQLRLSRIMNTSGQDDITLSGWNRVEPVEDSLNEILGGVSQEVYNTVFAIGLNELRKLSTLQDGDVAESLYSSSLAPEGAILLHALQSANHSMRNIFDAEHSTGTLQELLDRRQHIQKSLHELGDPREQHDGLNQRKSKLETTLEELYERRTGMNSQLRGHQFLARVHGPWQQVQEAQEALNNCPEILNFPADGLDRLNQLEQEISSETRCRSLLRNEYLELKNQLKATPLNQKFHQQSAGIQDLHANRSHIKQLQDQINSSQAELAQLEHHLEDSLSRLEPEWTRERIDQFDPQPEHQIRLLNAARQLQQATIRQGRFRRIYRRLSKTCRRQKARLERQQVNDGTGSFNRNAQLKAASEQLQLHQQEQLLSQKLSTLHGEQAESASRAIIPQWFKVVLLVFAAAGGLAVLAGVVSGLTLNALSGLVLALSGLTGLGIAKGLQSQFTRADEQEMNRRRVAIREAEFRLQETRTALKHFIGKSNESSESSSSITHQLLETATAIASDNERQRALRQYEQRRRRLNQLRSRIPRIQQVINDARKQWCDVLTEMGITPSLKISETLELWQHLLKIFSRREAVQRQQTKLQSLQSEFSQLTRRVDRIAEHLNEQSPNPEKLLERINEWNEHLESENQHRQKRRQLRRELNLRRREIRKYTRRISILERKRATLLAQGGANNREEFERRAGFLAQRVELLELKQLAEEELRLAAATEPDLAIVEEDLRAFNRSENAECLQTLQAELQEIESDIKSTHEEIGRIKQSLDELSKDRQRLKLQTELASVQRHIKNATEKWLGIRLAQQALQTLQTHYERDKQPQILKIASDFFRQLTNGQYKNLWTPLGEKTIVAEDSQGQNLRVEILSQGTREQLFLAIRLAMIAQFRERGIELPILLDDVLVNFDQHRTDAAVKTLVELGNTGQQILFFTCHQHLVEMFREHDVEHIELSDLTNSSSKRMAG
ncbi:MAG: hypothetical protein Tsb009_12890 [Planctomycetaceae bacterium]